MKSQAIFTKSLKHEAFLEPLGNNLPSLPASTQNGTRPRLSPYKCLGPHNIDILSIIFGSLLGDACGQLRTTNKGVESVRFLFEQSSTNVEYLM